MTKIRTGQIGAVGDAWTNFTATVTAGSGTFTTVSGTVRYIQMGKTVFFSAQITITTNGTAASSVVCTLPVAVSSALNTYIGTGRADAVSGKALEVKMNGGTSNMTIFNYDNTYPGASGEVLRVGGSYEAA